MTKKKAVEIVVDPGNARVHGERNQQVIQESLRELGAGRSIVIDKAGQVIAGNETYRQAKALGLPVKIVESDGQTLIVVQRKDLAPEDERRRALAIADNRSSDLSEFEMGILATTLKEAGPELRDAMGFTEKELAQVFRQAQPKELKDPPAPPLPGEARAKPGQLFTLGPHRLLCGDAIKKKDVKRLMAGEKAALLMTDPPYGIGVCRMTMGAGKKEFQRGNWDSERPNLVPLLDVAPISCIWGGNYFTDQLPPSNDWLCWHKKNDGRSFSEFELGWTNYGRNCRLLSHHWGGEQKQHITQKPVAVIGWAIDESGATGLVLDLFGGSGSTLIACDQLERECRMMEIDPGYCDVIIRRYAEFKEIDVEEIYAAAQV